MSRGERFSQFNSAARSFLEADVGAADDEPCGIGPCEDDAVYRVPWHSVGGDIAYCGYHLARYRKQHPDLFDRVQEAVDEDLTAHATRGQRFLSFDDVPETLFDEEFVAVALLATGNALYEEDDPGKTVTYIVVDRTLEEDSTIEVTRDRAGEFLREVESRLGVHEWDDDVAEKLLGGERA
jgi:hypothetical protein